MKNPSEAFGIRTCNLPACTLNRATVHPCRNRVVVVVVVVVRLSAETVAINEVYQTVPLIC
jgi:hypothetical protein